mgnify:FL=1
MSIDKTLKTKAAVIALASLTALGACGETAEDPNAVEIVITLKDHVFVPPIVEAPANTALKLVIRNQDSSAAEFESHDLDLEKIIQGNQEATLYASPLKPGTYEFFDEFNEDTAQGKLVVK